MKKHIAIAEELYDRTAKAAATDRVSVDEFVSSLLLNQLASRAYIESRAKLFKREDFEAALQAIPDTEPEEHDRI